MTKFSGSKFTPYYTWSILVNGTETTKPHPMLSTLTQMEKEHMLVLMTRIVYSDSILTELANKQNEAAILKIFANLLDAYCEWLQYDFSGLNPSTLAFMVFERFPEISHSCNKNKNYSKDFMYAHLTMMDSYWMRNVKTMKDFEKRVDASVATFRAKLTETRGIIF